MRMVFPRSLAALKDLFIKTRKSVLRAVAVALLLPVATPARPEVAAAQTTLAPIAAHPALWKVQGDRGIAYLFGSIHALPPNVNWQTPQLSSAITQSDVFVFEVRPDALQGLSTSDFVQKRGMLAAGQNLRTMLSPNARSALDQEVEKLHLPIQAIDRMQPWLASLVLGMSQVTQAHYAASAGVDMKIFSMAKDSNKAIRALETADQQLGMLADGDQAGALKNLESDLIGPHRDDSNLGPLVGAWSTGDQSAIDRLMNSGLAQYPGLRQKILGDRNHVWVKQIERMLAEPHRFFITVGAGHLAGRDGVPALLRDAGYRVTRL